MLNNINLKKMSNHFKPHIHPAELLRHRWRRYGWEWQHWWNTNSHSSLTGEDDELWGLEMLEGTIFLVAEGKERNWKNIRELAVQVSSYVYFLTICVWNAYGCWPTIQSFLHALPIIHLDTNSIPRSISLKFWHFIWYHAWFFPFAGQGHSPGE